VGVSLAQITNPVKILFPKNTLGGTLVLEIDGAFGPEIQMQSALIIEKVNKVYGYTAISRISIRQVAANIFKRNEENATSGTLSFKDENCFLLDEINKINDLELRNRLKSLGSLLKTKNDNLI
jgi:hypothetical protein